MIIAGNVAEFIEPREDSVPHVSNVGRTFKHVPLTPVTHELDWSIERLERGCTSLRLAAKGQNPYPLAKLAGAS